MASSPVDTTLAAKLDILIRLQATALVDRLPTQRERIAFLNRAGLTPKAIGEILGTSANSVSVALSKMKKGAANDGDA
jgi:DNA-binding NarL/FixJ family response regulator